MAGHSQSVNVKYLSLKLHNIFVRASSVVFV